MQDLRILSTLGVPRALLMALLAVSIALPSAKSSAQSDFPSTPVRLVVIVSPGGQADAVARVLAARVFPKLGQPAIVDNRPGAGGNIASEYVAKSPPDGYTLLLTANNHTLNPLIYTSAGYDAKKDFVPVVALTRGPDVLVTPADSPFKSLKELVDAARAKPNALTYGSAGVGMTSHVAMEIFLQAAKIEVLHVPFKGAGQALQSLLGSHIQLAMSSLSAALPYIETGKLRALGVTSSERWPGSPDIPTIAEQGYPSVVYLVWLGILAPSGTPPQIVTRLNREFAAALSTADIREQIAAMGAAPVGGSPADFEAMLKADLEANERIVAKTGLKVE